MKMIVAFVAGLVAAPLLLIVVGMLGWLGSTGTGDPPKWEASLGNHLVRKALEKRAASQKNPIQAGDQAALAAGQKLYANNCAGCHGSRTGPSDWGNKGFYPRVPQFWEGDAAGLTPEQAYAAIHDGIRYSGMGAWRDLMKEDEIWHVANFVAGIDELRRERRSNPPQPNGAGGG